ncbi:putative Zn-dependent protease, TldD [Hyperthermus butylicus DSM 5456]|uniref:Zn-dependent protease, TldD n=1 Tax=Hyperthermus butylicus (strain DSM 5456 / JCM 9403 / PLM1-5) TaxID=415426 RepID=A2BJW5_HYPBU|nr:putative Zn-dependent protease, TldD [Hyperthermus butylicus DSM 5456]
MLDDIRDILVKALGFTSGWHIDLADIRVERIQFTRIDVENGTVKISSGIDYGAAVRVFVNGVMGFAFTTRVTVDSLRRALEQAYSMASAHREKLSKPLTFEAVEDYYEAPVKRSIVDVPIDAKLSDVLELDKAIASAPQVKSRRVVYVERVEERYYASTEDRVLGEKRELVYVYASAFGVEAGVRAAAHVTQGTIKGYYVWEKTSQEQLAQQLLKRLTNQFKAKTPKAGNFPVVLAPEALGVFVHEAFGHLAEADLVVAGSALQGKKGEKVASELVTIVDDPTIEDGFGTIKYDDEGVRTARAVIVERGIHKQVMTDRVHAAMLNENPTGNARAESFRHAPLVRMRNTVLLPGDHSVEEVFEGIRFGYYVVATSGGQTNMDGSFQVGIEEAYEIVNGEVGEPVRNLSIAGNTLETLMNIDAVAKDFKVFYGRCGKGQLVYVSDGGPHARVKKMTVGGRE